MDLKKISDHDLEAEYQNRFRIGDGSYIRSSDAAAKHLATFLARKKDREAMAVAFLSGRNQVIKTEILFNGTLTSSAIYPRVIIKRIIELDAAAIIIAHNHPSGNDEPSADDRVITKKIKEACQTIDVQLHDHIIIIPGGGYSSFSDRGML